jgi:hypothetical protein
MLIAGDAVPGVATKIAAVAAPEQRLPARLSAAGVIAIWLVTQCLPPIYPIGTAVSDQATIGHCVTAAC